MTFISWQNLLHEAKKKFGCPLSTDPNFQAEPNQFNVLIGPFTTLKLSMKSQCFHENPTHL